MVRLRRYPIAALLLAAACHRAPAPGEYLFVWAGDSAATASDFLAVLDADPASPKYGSVVASLATGVAGTHPHHTEAEMPASGHLLANGFQAGRTWLFDLTTPTRPKILTEFADLAGFSHPHTFVRLANGHVLSTFQYRAESTATAAGAAHPGMLMGAEHATGGLVEMDERGTVIRSGSAADTTIADRHIYPYSVLPLPDIDRAVSTTTDMDHGDTVATSEWVQFWRLSDLTLLGSLALPPGPRPNDNHLTGEPHLLPDGRSVYIHTFGCGLYLVRGIDGPSPAASFVRNFEGEGCGVPVLTAHYWLQPVPEAHALIALDITDPEHPKETSTVLFGEDERPHWLAIDPSGKRLVLNSGARGGGNRLFVINFDPVTGQLAIDRNFRDAGSDRPGIRLSGKSWPHGFTGTAVPHGTVFSR